MPMYVLSPENLDILKLLIFLVIIELAAIMIVAFHSFDVIIRYLKDIRDNVAMNNEGEK